MTTFPITNKKYSRWFRSASWLAKFVDVNELPQKMYMVLDGKLKAIKPVATAYALPTTAGRSHPELYLVAEIAGEPGKKLINFVCEYTEFYHSVEEFNANRAFTLQGKYLEEVLNNAGYETYSMSAAIYPVYYSWDSIRCQASSSRRSGYGLPVSVWSDSFGIHVDWSDSEDVCVPALKFSMKKKMYRTADDCRKDNAVQVVEFEDEQESTGIMDTTNGHSPKLVEKINEVWKMHQTWWEFTLIVSALMHRDGSQILEVLDKEIAQYTDDEEMVAELGPEYLQHIADDQDLATILQFVGYDRSDH